MGAGAQGLFQAEAHHPPAVKARDPECDAGPPQVESHAVPETSQNVPAIPGHVERCVTRNKRTVAELFPVAGPLPVLP